MPRPRPSPAPPTDPIVFVGALHVDELFWPEAPLTLRASNPVRRTRRIGGVAANTARAAAAELHRSPRRDTRTDPEAPIRAATRGRDRPVVLVAALGDDADANWLAETLVVDGVDCHPVRVAGRASGRYTAVHDDAGELLVGLSDVDVAETLEARSVRAGLEGVRPAAVVLDANLHPDCLATLLDREANADAWSNVPRVALAVSPHKASRLVPHLARLDLLFCNRREAAALGGVDATASPDALADGLFAAGAARFVLSDGPSPALVHGPEGRRHLPVPPVAIDGSVNGAGDALAGAALARWLADGDLPAAVVEAGLPAARAVLRAPCLPPSGPIRSERSTRR